MSPKRVDANQREIVQAVRSIGATVLLMSDLGKGAPDIAVGFRRKTYFFEIKDGSKPLSAQALTEHEERFEELWEGHYQVVRSVDEILKAIGAME